ncbi:SGNH/GDSL hydrolase family protein [Candidatus Gottesmanbacteria bacterium]|nr:SGNH/GDSL hydrolase family protein [Candidatus Gottesmanbacteria bacterium]
MTKLILVISCFFIFLLLFTLQPVQGAYSLRQSSVDGKSQIILIKEPENSVMPNVSFGNLLGLPSKTQSLTPFLNSTLRANNIKSVLAQLDEYQPIKNNFPTPTPQILGTSTSMAIPTLISAVSSFVQGDDELLPLYTPTPTPITTLVPQIGDLVKNPKNTYIIALLGDSMVDTMGRDLRVLNDYLKEAFPTGSFALLNYGFGSTDMESGLTRLTRYSTYLDKFYPPVLSYRPDILVVESFAYNHWSGNQYDLDRHWLTIAKIIDIVKEKSPSTQIVLFSTIAPHPLIFGDGALNWPATMKWQSAQIIKSYLENMTRFAISEKYPLADAYHPSLDYQGYGIKTYINPGDNLHLSDEGRRFVSKKIVDTIKENKLIQ